MNLSFIVRPDFDPEDHIYRVDGNVKESVTGILAGVGLSDNGKAGTWTIDPDVLDYAAERGTCVHEATELDDLGLLDDESCDDEVFEYVEAYRDFVADTGFVSVACEVAFHDAEFDYCGTFDKVGYIGEDLYIIDLKTASVGLKPWHKYQLAAYARPFFKETGKWPKRMMLHLRPELKRKKYREYHFSEKSAEWDWAVFAAARTIAIAKVLDIKTS